MKKTYNQSQIISILQEGEKGVSISDICRKYGIAKSTYHKWKSKYNGMSISDSERLKVLELENNRLKRLVADLSLETIALKDVLSKKW